MLLSTAPNSPYYACGHYVPHCSYKYNSISIGMMCSLLFVPKLVALFVWRQAKRVALILPPVLESARDCMANTGKLSVSTGYY